MTWIIVIFLGVVIPLLDREFKILGFLQEVYVWLFYLGMLAFIGLLLYMICDELW